MAGRHYLDHASTAPARPEVIEAMLPWLAGDGAADPSRVHTEGRMARAALEGAREEVAAFFGARPREVVFTSGGTEAINAVAAGLGGVPSQGRDVAGGPGDVAGGTGSVAGGPGEAVALGSDDWGGPVAVAVAPVEHSAVRDSAAARGQAIVPLTVDRLGRIDLGSVEAALAAGARLVHCQWGNHEVGTLQPVAEVVALCQEAGVLVHVDAVQAAGRVPIDFRALGADLVSVSAHKVGGPKGIGALLVRRGLRLERFIVGGDQERARRAGIENVPAAAGWAALCGSLDVEAEAARDRALVDRLAEAAAAVPGVSRLGDPDGRLPHLLCLAVEGVEAEAVLLGLDQSGVAAHSGSACSSELLEPSPVLEAMGVDAQRSLRLSVGWSTAPDAVAAFEQAFAGVVARLRALAG